MQNIVIAQAQSAVDGIHQFPICCFTFCGFFGISLIQGLESICHILVDGIESIRHILVDLLDNFVLGFIGTNPGGGFFGQSSIQVGYILTDSLICFDDGSVLYRCVVLAYIVLVGFTQHVLFYIGNPFIQGIQVLAHSLRRNNRCPVFGRFISNSRCCGNGSSGNAVTFNCGRGRSFSSII